MKASPAARKSFLSALVILVFSGFSVVAQSTASTTASFSCGSGYCSGGLSFGTPPETGSPCVLRGICDDNGGAVNVTFKTSSEYPNVLIMTFSLSELQQAQPDQATYFTSGSYTFDGNYCLSTDPFFAPLNLPANSWILTTSNSNVKIDGDVVTDYIVYSVVGD
jgi:hypothetical protein